MKSKLSKETIFLVVCFLVFVGALYWAFFASKTNKEGQLPQNQKQVTPLPTKVVAIPTKTPEEIKIIAKIETKVIVISDSKVEPAVLNVKPYDQVVFQNKSSKTIKINGDGLAQIPVAKGESLVKAYETAGQFDIQIVGTSLTAQIVVK